MGRLTTDGSDVGLGRGPDTSPVPQNEVYLVADTTKTPRVRPFRASYRHAPCGSITTMSSPIAETYAVNPGFYGYTYCVSCRMHKPVGEFTWTADGLVVGS